MQSTDEQKKFDLVPAKDKDTDKILGARNSVLEDVRLSDGARMYFCWLLDAALNHDRWYYRGAVRASILYLKSKLHRCKRSFNKWNRELTDGRHIWISKLPGKNTHFFNLYHITALEPEDVGEFFARDAMWGNGSHHPGFADARNGGRDARGQFQKSGHGANSAPSPAVETAENPSDFVDCAPDGGKKEPLTGANDATGSGTSSHLPMAKDAIESGTSSHLPMAQPRASQRQGCALIKESELGDTVPKPSTKTISKGNKRAVREITTQEFVDRMTDLTIETFGAKAALQDAKNFGKQWRACFNEDGDRAWRAFLDVRDMAKRGEVSKSVGATWRLRWKEFASRKEVRA